MRVSFVSGLFVIIVKLIAAAAAQPPDFAALEMLQNGANAKPGPRSVPGRTIRVPDDVSPAAQALIAGPYNATWNVNPSSAEEWRALVRKLADARLPGLEKVRETLGVSMKPTVIGGVNGFILTPKEIPEAHRNQLIIAAHGGGYVFYPGVSGTLEATLMAAYGGYKVIEFDYRMAPDFPYPAALDDAMAVWKAALAMQDPRRMAIIGTSAGGGLTLAMVLRAKQEGLPLPAAIAPGTPASDLTDTGDSYKTNEWLDNVLVSYEGFVRRSVVLYANDHDLKDPFLSPIYGDFHGFPPAILTTGTRDLLLSNTVRVHRKLRQAGVEAELEVFDGLSHAQYLYAATGPETKEAFGEITTFFDRHLAR
jgi:acetyl esterase/lipase